MEKGDIVIQNKVSPLQKKKKKKEKEKEKEKKKRKTDWNYMDKS